MQIKKNKLIKNIKFKAIFLDRDGVINVDKGYVSKKSDFEFISGVIDALKLFLKLGYKLFIVTNQSGIARGYFSEEDFFSLNSHMLELLLAEGIDISKIKYCPHYEFGKIEKFSFKCECRKPNSKMIDELIEEFNIDIEGSFMIGDKLSDVKAGKKSGLRTVLISDSDFSTLFVDYVSKDLFHASKLIFSL